jgi:hypothetical protein
MSVCSTGRSGERRGSCPCGARRPPELLRYFGRMRLLQPGWSAQLTAKPRLFAPLACWPPRRSRDGGGVTRGRHRSRGRLPFPAGQINIPGGCSFTTWAGSCLPDRDVVLIADGEGCAPRARARAFLVGVDRLVGWGRREIIDAQRAAVRPRACGRVDARACPISRCRGDRRPTDSVGAGLPARATSSRDLPGERRLPCDRTPSLPVRVARSSLARAPWRGSVS